MPFASAGYAPATGAPADGSLVITGTFNGWNIVALPSAPGLRSVDWTMNDSVDPETSPFSRITQIQDWMADWWEGQASFPPMPRSQAAAVIAWLGELRGMGGVFYLGDPLGRIPQGMAQGVPLVNGANASEATSLLTRGWAPSKFGLLMPGDYVQIGVRLHLALDRVDSDSSGGATINIWPRIREAQSDGAPVIVSNAKGLMRLSGNARKYSTNETRLIAVSFEFEEAR